MAMAVNLPPARFVGPRLRLVDGHAELQPAVTPPPGMVPGRFSVLSPGTESRHLHDSSETSRDAGYMTLGMGEDGRWLLAAVPHGAAFDPAGPTLVAPPGVDVRAAALGRFQQMAVLGLDRLPTGVDLDQAVVVGSGPVALGCVLELRRRGVADVRVVTSRRRPPIAAVDGVSCVADLDQPAALVIDAVGRPGQVARLVASGGVLGLLGTPAADVGFDMLQAHRSGWTVVGMHELVDQGAFGAAAYTAAVSWLADHVGSALLDGWCQLMPGRSAPAVYDTLARPGDRGPYPVVIFSWDES